MTSELYKADKQADYHLLKERTVFDNLVFNPPKDEENGEALFVEVTPDIAFKIDWAEELIVYKVNEKGEFVLDLVGETHVLTKGKERKISLKNPQRVLKDLSKNPLLKVVDKSNGKAHYYYPEHLNIQRKPIDINLTMKDLLKLWELKGDNVSYLTDYLETAAAIWEDALVNLQPFQPVSEGALNKMAAHLHALSRLEQRIENRPEDRMYYLTTDNVDTLISYRKRLIDWEKQENGGMNKGFVWLLLSIILQKFYKVKGVDKRKQDIKREIEILKNQIKELQKKIIAAGANTKNLTAQLDWVLEMIKSEEK